MNSSGWVCRWWSWSRLAFRLDRWNRLGLGVFGSSKASFSLFFTCRPIFLLATCLQMTYSIIFLLELRPRQSNPPCFLCCGTLIPGPAVVSGLSIDPYNCQIKAHVNWWINQLITEYSNFHKVLPKSQRIQIWPLFFLRFHQDLYPSLDGQVEIKQDGIKR